MIRFGPTGPHRRGAAPLSVAAVAISIVAGLVNSGGASAAPSATQLSRASTLSAEAHRSCYGTVQSMITSGSAVSYLTTGNSDGFSGVRALDGLRCSP